jgi:hypothetical protein
MKQVQVYTKNLNGIKKAYYTITLYDLKQTTPPKPAPDIYTHVLFTTYFYCVKTAPDIFDCTYNSTVVSCKI